MTSGLQPTISTAEAARLLGLTSGRVRQLLGAKQHSGYKHNERSWAVFRASVVARMRENEPIKVGTD